MKRLPLLLLAILAGAAPAWPWWSGGHHTISLAAVRALPSEVPAFFREGAATVAHCSIDPDVVKNRATPALRDTETPEHYFDQELLEGRALPATRYEYLRLCREAKLDPTKVGLLPYAVTEWTERLAVAFAEHRKWPDNPHIRSKCLVYAGILAHYAGDLSQPLHVTIHFDGRARKDGSSPRTGIHDRVDALIERLELPAAELARDQKLTAYEAILPAVTAEIDRSRAFVDRVYELEGKLPPERGEWTPTPEIRAFATERARAGTRFVGSLYLTAWRKSAGVRVPGFLQREG